MDKSSARRNQFERFSRRALLAACLLGMTCGAQAYAQGVPEGLPNLRTQDAGVLQNTNRDYKKEELQQKTLEAKPAEDGASIDTQQAGASDNPAENVEEVRFPLKELEVSGVTLIPAKELEEQFSTWIDKDVTYQDLLNIADEISKLYKKKGFITTRAIIPPQDIENGIVKIHVVEGKIGKIEIKGNRWVRTGYIDKRLHQNEGEIFKIQALEKDIVGLNGNGLFDKVHATLKPGQEPGTSDIQIDVDDHFPMHMAISADNQGRNAIGLYRGGVTLTHENLLGFGDSAAGNVQIGAHSVSAFGQYKFPLTSSGWNIGANYIYSYVDLGLTERGIRLRTQDVEKRRDITGDTKRLSLFTEFPIYRSDSGRWNLSGDVSYNMTESRIFVDGKSLELIADEEFTTIRSIVSGVNINEQDKTGRWLLRGTMTNAIKSWGGNRAFLKFNADLTRVQNLSHGLVGLLRVQTQMTPDRLPGLEQMQIGGANSVRGVAEGYMLADSGYMISTELRFPLYGTPKFIKDNWQGLVFLDHAGVFITGPDDHPRASGLPGFLTGYGVGFRGRITKYLTGRVDLGMTLNDFRDQPDLRAHFSLSSQLF